MYQSAVNHFALKEFQFRRPLSVVIIAFTKQTKPYQVDSQNDIKN